MCFLFCLQAEATSSPFTSRTSGRNNRKMDLPAPPLPASNGSRPRQMVLAEAATTPRGWDNGVGGYQTNSILETRIGGTQEGRKLLLEICNFQYIHISLWAKIREKSSI